MQRCAGINFVDELSFDSDLAPEIKPVRDSNTAVVDKHFYRPLLQLHFSFQSTIYFYLVSLSNMVSSRVKKSSLLSLALLGSLAAVINADEAPTLLRKRIESENKSLTEAKNEQRDLWDEVAAKAQFEDELDAYRDLQVMSMPSTPTMAPFQLPTLSPVICSGYSRENYLMQILSQVTDVNLLQNRLTPQGAAFHHMSKFDTYLQNPCNKDIPQRYGLLTLYFSTAGAQWTDNSGWTEEGNECNWIGVTCFQGVVTELDLGTSF
jgi:hypothetical protein